MHHVLLVLLRQRGLRRRHAAAHQPLLTVREPRHAARGSAARLRGLAAPRPAAARRLSLLEQRQQIVRALPEHQACVARPARA